jgi:hypothetical protein
MNDRNWKMRKLALTAALIVPGHASAHEAVAAHAHPHGDWTLTGIGLLAVGLAAAAILPVLRARRERNRK